MINTINIFSDERRFVYNILLCIANPILKGNYAILSLRFFEIYDKIIDI